MNCPFCIHKNSQVLESRVVDGGGAVRRRRECVNCGKRFTTYEKVRGNVLWVVKKDGRKEAYDGEKIKRGIMRAVEKRPVDQEMVQDIVDQVEREMLRKQKEEVTSQVIGRAVLKRLKRLDKVAWLRFASVYLEFEDTEDFIRAIKKS